MARGRRPGGADTREAIVAAARTHFAERGYDGTSLRGIARDAGVDPALVHHYFDGKDALLAEVLELPVDVRAVLPTIVEGDPARLGERVTRFYLGLWTNPATKDAVRALIRSAAASDLVAKRFADTLQDTVLRVLRERLPGDGVAGDTRGALAATHLIGLAFGRYVVRVPALADVPEEELVAIVAPTIQHYLLGDLAYPAARVLGPEPDAT